MREKDLGQLEKEINPVENNKPLLSLAIKKSGDKIIEIIKSKKLKYSEAYVLLDNTYTHLRYMSQFNLVGGNDKKEWLDLNYESVLFTWTNNFRVNRDVDYKEIEDDFTLGILIKDIINILKVQELTYAESYATLEYTFRHLRIMSQFTDY
ncbi:MAG: hypothetical protein RR460_07845 [Clostridium sp.]